MSVRDMTHEPRLACCASPPLRSVVAKASSVFQKLVACAQAVDLEDLAWQHADWRGTTAKTAMYLSWFLPWVWRRNWARVIFHKFHKQTLKILQEPKMPSFKMFQLNIWVKSGPGPGFHRGHRTSSNAIGRCPYLGETGTGAACATGRTRCRGSYVGVLPLDGSTWLSAPRMGNFGKAQNYAAKKSEKSKQIQK